MSFAKVNPITEAIELQKMFKDDPEAKETFHQYELAHREKASTNENEKPLRVAV